MNCKHNQCWGRTSSPILIAVFSVMICWHFIWYLMKRHMTWIKRNQQNFYFNDYEHRYKRTAHKCIEKLEIRNHIKSNVKIKANCIEGRLTSKGQWLRLFHLPAESSLIIKCDSRCTTLSTTLSTTHSTTHLCEQIIFKTYINFAFILSEIPPTLSELDSLPVKTCNHCL